MNIENEFALIIPARYKSSRFPGKPLIDLCGKPMIYHVWARCSAAVGEDHVYVATDDSRIANVVESFGGKVLMTSEKCATGTDRVAEAAQSLGCEYVVNVQGDEPLIDPADIKVALRAFEPGGGVVNAMRAIKSESEFQSFNVPKVVCDQRGELLYMSRSPIPISKSGGFVSGFKQVCIYVFSLEHLKQFAASAEKTPLEAVEDIEILRFLEMGVKVKMVEVGGNSIAVDVPEDVEKVLAEMRSE